MKKTIVTFGLIASAFGVQAQDQSIHAPSNSYFELGYGKLDGVNSPDIWNIDVNHGFTDHLSWGAQFFTLDNGSFDINHFELNFGYKTGISQSTDFFTKVHVGQEDRKYFDSAVYGLAIGTRSSLGANFELHSELKYNELEKIDDGYFTAEIKGVYKFNDQSGLGLALQSWDGDDTGYELSYRHSF